MIFTLGIIVGILISLLVVVTLVFFRRVIENKVTIIEKQIESKGPKPKGFIFEPEDDLDEMRSSMVAKNSARGRITKAEDLM